MKIGILGSGQLGRMLALSGYPLDLQFRVMDPNYDPVQTCVSDGIRASYDDRHALERFRDGLDLVTYEFENIPVLSLRALQAMGVPCFPSPDVLEMAQDRLTQKETLTRLGIQTAPFASVTCDDDLKQAVQTLGLPAILKTRRSGYDGRGQVILTQASDLDFACRTLAHTALILEKKIAFDRELSIIAVRNRSGDTAFYPLGENHHRSGILSKTIAPAPHLTPALQAAAEAIAQRILDTFTYVGVLVIELFQVGSTLLVNEVATRVHNSGHWTINGAETSQFENHLRAILDWPLGSTHARGVSAMLNCIGEMPDPRAVLALENAHLHDYHKTPRPGRKMGHITICAEHESTLENPLKKAEGLLTGLSSG